MRASSSMTTKNLRKRKINAHSEIFFPSSSTSKSKTNINFHSSFNSRNKHQNKSQIQLKYKSDGFNSTRNSDLLLKQKLLTPKNRINLNISAQNEIPKIFDNNSIYKSIMSKLENLMTEYKQDMMKLYYILTYIENFIITIIEDEESNKEKSNEKKIIQKSLSAFSKGKTIKYNLEYKDRNKENKENKNNSPQNNNLINISNNLIDCEPTEADSVILKRKINKLIIKINEMESKFKIEKLKYLFCIGEYQKKVAELEKKLNMNSIDNMPKDELKKFLCYPHYVKFDVKEEINPKSIPMYNLRKNKCYSSVHDNRINKKILLGKSENIINSSDSDIKKNKENINNINSFDFLNDKIININNNDKTDLYNIEEENIIEKDKQINYEEVKRLIELGNIKFGTKSQSMDIFLGKNKNYFISHPKINYIKNLNDGSKIASWKLENQINSLPKQISKLKMLSKSQKNQMVVFPSFLNETIVNLEKLRTNKNFRSIENKFEETFKLKIKN